MQIQTRERMVETSGAVESNNVTIDASGKMFYLIMSGLYSNKAQSITREIWSNAYDAHCEAGKEDVPFEVTMPSRFRPEFTVRDFGNGLSHEYMTKFYTRLGFSTKEDTNQAVGKWGIGRMSPTAYTDTFNVTSIHNGLKAIYSVVKGSDGEPKVNTFVAPHPTDEKSGLKVSFPVSANDAYLFEQAAKRVSLGFKTKPIVVGQPNYNWPKFSITVENKDYSFYQSFEVSGPIVRMGCVLYPINMKLFPEYSTYQHSNILFECPIGSLEVTGSREDLSYGPDEPTKETILGKFKSVLDNYKGDLNKIANDTTSLFDRYTRIHDFLKSVPYQQTKTLLDNVVMDGKGYREWTEDIKYPYLSTNYQGTKVYTTVSTLFTTKSRPCLLMYTNGPKKVKAYWNRTRKLVLSGKDVWFIRLVWDEAAKEYFYCGQSEKEIIDIFTKTFGSDIKFLSGNDLPELPKRAKKSVVKCRSIEGVSVEVDFEEGGFYIPTTSNVVTGYPKVTVFDVAKLAIFFGLIKEDQLKEVYIVPATYHKKVVDNNKWVSVLDKVISFLDKGEYCKKPYKTSPQIPFNVTLEKCTSVSEIIREAFNWKNIAHNQHKINLLQGALRDLGYKRLQTDNGNFEEKILNRYPMLKELKYAPDQARVIEYIKLVENSKKV